MDSRRLEDLVRFYKALSILEGKLRALMLAECTGRMDWPRRGVYFFREAGEQRSDSGEGYRIVRVGTHGLKVGGSTTLWNRLSQHRGQRRGGGNHRGSIFRLIVGKALATQRDYAFPTWGVGNTATSDVRSGEARLEQEVSRTIGAMPFLFVAIDDPAGPESLRGYIERNSIALLSNFGKEKLDPSSANWLGHYCDRERVRQSGLWNSNHVHEPYDPSFLASLEHLIDEVRPPS